MTHSKILEPDALATLGDGLCLETMLLRMEEMEVRSGLQALVGHGGGGAGGWPLAPAEHRSSTWVSVDEQDFRITSLGLNPSSAANQVSDLDKATYPL